MLVTIGPMERIVSEAVAFHHPMSRKKRQCKTVGGRHWYSNCTPSLHSCPLFSSLPDGNMLGLLIYAILNSLSESFKLEEASDMVTEVWTIPHNPLQDGTDTDYLLWKKDQKKKR